MSEHYNTGYSKKEIATILQKIKDCVSEGKFTIALNENRKENLAFVRQYNLKRDRRRRILLQIETEDFCYSLQNTNRGFEHEVLYVFCPQVVLYDLYGEKKRVDVYTKFNVLDLVLGSRVVVISFHERNKPLDYLFR